MNMLHTGQIDMETMVFDVEFEVYKKVSEIEELKNVLLEHEENNITGNSDLPSHVEAFFSMEKESKILTSQNQINNSDFKEFKHRILPGTLIIAGLIFFVLMFFFFLNSGETKLEKQQETSSIEKIISLWNGTSDDNKSSEQVINANVYGDIAPAVVLTQDIYAEMNDSVNRLEKELQDSNVQNMLTQATLENPDKVKNTIIKVKDIIGTIDQTINEMNKLLKEYRAKADDLDIPDGFKERFLKGIQDSNKENISQITGHYEIGKKIMRHVEIILEFMSQKQGKYIYADGRLVFDISIDTTTYNKMIDILNQYVKEEEDYLKKTDEKSSNQISRYEKDLN